MMLSAILNKMQLNISVMPINQDYIKIYLYPFARWESNLCCTITAKQSHEKKYETFVIYRNFCNIDFIIMKSYINTPVKYRNENTRIAKSA